MVKIPLRRVLSPPFRRVSFRFALPIAVHIIDSWSSRYGLDIAIVGAGTAGLALAALLGRTHRITVVEQAEAPQPFGAGLLLQPTGMQVLQRMGLLAPLLELGERIERLHGTLKDRADGRPGWPVMDIRYRDLHHKAFGLGLSRHALFTTLRDAAQRAGARLVTGGRVGEIRQDVHGAWLEGGGADPQRFDVCVVANGAFSALRQQIGVRHHDRPCPWGALWALLPDRSRAFEGTLRQWYRGAHEMLGLMPSGLHGRQEGSAEAPWISLFWSARADRVDALRAQSIEAWKARALALAPAAAPYLQTIERWDQLAWARYADVRMPRPWKGRVIFIGDSAHGMSPQLGQGANLALIDAFVLAGALARCGTDAPLAEIQHAFKHHATTRQAHLGFYQQASRWLTPLFQSDALVAPWLRNVCLWPASRTPLVRRYLVRTLAGTKAGWLYGKMRLPE